MAIRQRELGIWVNGERAGTWRLGANAQTELQYDDTWLASKSARPLSLSLPLPIDNVPHKGKVVDSYFDNLLPESEPIRRRIQERYQASTQAAFDLLAAIGRDCVGAIQILPADQVPPRIDRIEVTRLTDKDIAAELAWVTSARGPARDEDELRISIAGAQAKTAFTRHEDHWCRPLGSTPTTHIFKLPIGLIGSRQADMTASVENEWLCARIVKAFGLPVAHCEMGTFGEHRVLIVERFDRQLHTSGKYWLRLMQEDFAQATGTPWLSKYQADGGPGLDQLATILASSQEARADLVTLFHSQILFRLLAATDGHAKNFSIRLLAGSRFRLTPLYDVISLWPVIGKKASEIPLQKVKLAMALPGERPHYLLQGVQRRHFIALGQKLGLASQAELLLDEFLGKTSAVLTQVQKGLPRNFPQTLLDRVLEGLRKSSAALQR